MNNENKEMKQGLVIGKGTGVAVLIGLLIAGIIIGFSLNISKQTETDNAVVNEQYQEEDQQIETSTSNVQAAYPIIKGYIDEAFATSGLTYSTEINDDTITTVFVLSGNSLASAKSDVWADIVDGMQSSTIDAKTMLSKYGYSDVKIAMAVMNGTSDELVLYVKDGSVLINRK